MFTLWKDADPGIDELEGAREGLTGFKNYIKEEDTGVQIVSIIELKRT